MNLRTLKSLDRGFVRAIIEQKAARTSLPPDVAEAVVFVESSYDAAVVGRVGEVRLMQVSVLAKMKAVVGGLVLLLAQSGWQASAGLPGRLCRPDAG